MRPRRNLSRNLKTPEAADDESRIRSVALALQSYREHGARELEAKLTRKGYDAVTSAQIIEELRESGLVSDSRFADAFVRSHANRGHGPIRIRYELRELGVSAELIESSLATSLIADHCLDGSWGANSVAAMGSPSHSAEAFDWSQLAAQVRRRKFGERPPGSFAERAKQMRFLQYRGFSGDQIRAAFSAMENQAPIDEFGADELPAFDPDD